MKVQSEAKALAGHVARNQELVAELRAKGESLSAARALDIFFYAPSEAAASSLANVLTSLGLTRVEVTRTTTADGAWCLEGHLQGSVEHMTSPDFTLELVQVAAKFGGEYDGWGTQL